MSDSPSNSRDSQLAEALEPILENAIRASIKKDRRILVDALFPVMGPAIRKAIASTIQGLIQNFNQILEHTVSFRGLRWRLEAIRTRRPFAEVVLLNTLIYQVEQVFLIHRESGLLAEHVVAKTAVAQNPDLVSGMLTAIKDFVQDSFGADQEDTLDTFQVGERKVWIEHGSYAMLAVVIQGNPSVTIREMMRDALDEIHLMKSEALSAFNGDCASFESIRPVLNGLLQVQFKKQQHKPPYRLWIVAAVVGVLIGWGVIQHMAAERRWGHFVDQLRNQPGIVVTELKDDGGIRHIYGLKDPYASDPSSLLEPAGILPGAVVFHWEPYQSAHAAFVRRRIPGFFNPPATVGMTFEQGTLQVSGSALNRWIEDARRIAHIIPWIDHYADQQVVDIDARLGRPASVSLALEGKTLRASGSASRSWIARARFLAGSLPGVEAYDDALLVDADGMEWASLSLTISETIFYFEAGHNQLAEGQEKKLQTFIGAVKRIIILAHLLDRPLKIDVIGHADQTGAEVFNIAISRKRAQVFADLLIEAGIDTTFVSIHAAGSREPARPGMEAAHHSANRRVAFRVNHTEN